ncbi:MAG: hypothetical protein KDH20_10680 [Rhodocyclaceae bacterium]|nr:hypothetical protein [Rhodocyclaceae bacterium]
MKTHQILTFLKRSGVPGDLARRALGRIAADAASRRGQSPAGRMLLALASGRKVQLPADMGGMVVGGGMGVVRPGSDVMEPEEEEVQMRPADLRAQRGGGRPGTPGGELMEDGEEEIQMRPWDRLGRAGRFTTGGKGPVDPGEMMPATRPRDPGTVMGSRARPVDPDEVMRSQVNDKVVGLAARVAAGG